MQKGNENILLAIQNGFWFIEKSYADAYLPIIQNLLKGDFSAFENKKALPSPFAVDPAGALAFSPSVWTGFTFAPPGSVAVIPVTGAIMKYDYCGALGTQTLISFLTEAAANPNIIGAILKIDSPGGTVAGTQAFADAVSAFKSVKPIVTYVDDLMASAALWGGINANEVFAGNPTARIGSIGTMLSFADAQAMYEKQGIVFHEIYADASSQKNKDFTEARAGNYDAVKKTLNAMNDQFVGAVISARGDKLNQKATLSGAMFMAQDALSNGLIDGIKSFDECVNRVQELSNQSNQSNQKNQSSMKIKSTWAAMIAFLTPSFAGVKADDIISEEMAEKMNTELASVAQVKADLATATERATKAEADLVAANKAKTDAETAKASVDAELEALKKANPGATSALKKGDDVVTGEENKNEFISEVDEQVAASRKALGYEYKK